MSAGADMISNSMWAAVAHPRVVIFVSLRMAASAEAPSAPMSLRPILRGMSVGHSKRAGVCQRALTQKQTLSGAWRRT